MEKREKITPLPCVYCGAHGKLIRPNKKSRPGPTHTPPSPTTKPYHLFSLLPPPVSHSCRRPPPLPPLLSVAATATPPSSTPPPVAQRAPAARLWVTIAAQAGSGDGVTARHGQEQRRCHSPARMGLPTAAHPCAGRRGDDGASRP